MDSNIVIIILIGISILLPIIVGLIIKSRSNKLLNQKISEIEKKAQDYRDNIYEIEKSNFQKILDSEFQEIKRRIDVAAAQAKQLDGEIEQKKEFNSNLLKIRQEELDRLMVEKYAAAEAKIQSDIDEWAESAQEAASEYAAQKIDTYRIIEEDYEEQIAKLQAELNEYQEKREAINQDILRQRKIKEEQDFYKIKLTEDSWQDIHFLISIIDHFNNKEIIYKLIWSEYIQKPFKSMMNRVLSNKDPRNVIYMIKNLETNEIYIGKTKAEVSKRWTEHIKTSLNIGTISRTNIHKALFNNWDKFSFTILEEVPLSSNLGERERYYIKFYESDIFGYNIKSGG